MNKTCNGRKLKDLALYEVIQLGNIQAGPRINLTNLKDNLKGIEMFVQDDGVLIKLNNNEFLVPSGSIKLMHLEPETIKTDKK